MYRDIPEDLRALIEPIVEDHGLELVDVEIQRGARTGALRITLDRPEGDGRVDIEVCALVSREIETHLDATEAMDATTASYRLEVSSPGLDRVLGRQKDFERAAGSEIKLATRRPHEGRRRFRGRLVRFENDVATVAVDGSEYQIPFEEVERANTVYEFTAADFADKAGRADRAGKSGKTGKPGSSHGNSRKKGRSKAAAGQPRGGRANDGVEPR